MRKAQLYVATSLDGFVVGDDQGAELLRRSLEAGEPVELHLDIVPILLGKGIPLFVDPPLTEAKLLDTALSATGVVRLSYRLNS